MQGFRGAPSVLPNYLDALPWVAFLSLGRILGLRAKPCKVMWRLLEEGAVTQPHERDMGCFQTPVGRDGPSGGQLLITPLESKTESA